MLNDCSFQKGARNPTQLISISITEYIDSPHVLCNDLHDRIASSCPINYILTFGHLAFVPEDMILSLLIGDAANEVGCSLFQQLGGVKYKVTEGQLH